MSTNKGRIDREAFRQGAQETAERLKPRPTTRRERSSGSRKIS